MEAAELSGRGDVSLEALSVILEAWEEGADRGVAPEMMAYAALFTALTDLVAAFGEAAVSSLVEGLSKRIAQGEFTIARVKQ